MVANMSLNRSNINSYIDAYMCEAGGDIQSKDDTALDIIICEHCNIPAITHGFDIYECEHCGILLETRIDAQAEWRFYDGDGKPDPARCSMPVNPLLPQSSLSSIMLTKGQTNYAMRRTQKIHSWGAMTYKERCLHHIFQDMSLRSLNGCILNNITKTAHGYYKKISEMHVSRGEIRKGLIAASVYMACKKVGVPRTTQEIAEMFQVSERCVTRGNKKFTELWNRSGEEPILYADDCQANDYIIRYCSKLDTGNKELFNLTKQLSDTCHTHQLLTQNTPVSIAAACMFAAVQMLGLNFTRAQVSEITKTSEVTIAKCVKELQTQFEKLNHTKNNEKNKYI